MTSQIYNALDAVLPVKKNRAQNLVKKVRTKNNMKYWLESCSGHPITAAVSIPVYDDEGKLELVGLFGSLSTALAFLHQVLTPDLHVQAKKLLCDHYKQSPDQMGLPYTWEMVAVDPMIAQHINNYTDQINGAVLASNYTVPKRRSKPKKLEEGEIAPAKRKASAPEALMLEAGTYIVKSRLKDPIIKLETADEVRKARKRLKGRGGRVVIDGSSEFIVVSTEDQPKSKPHQYFAGAAGDVFVEVNKKTKLKHISSAN